MVYDKEGEELDIETAGMETVQHRQGRSAQLQLLQKTRYVVL